MVSLEPVAWFSFVLKWFSIKGKNFPLLSYNNIVFLEIIIVVIKILPFDYSGHRYFVLVRRLNK